MCNHRQPAIRAPQLRVEECVDAQLGRCVLTTPPRLVCNSSCRSPRIPQRFQHSIERTLIQRKRERRKNSRRFPPNPLFSPYPPLVAVVTVVVVDVRVDGGLLWFSSVCFFSFFCVPFLLLSYTIFFSSFGHRYVGILSYRAAVSIGICHRMGGRVLCRRKPYACAFACIDARYRPENPPSVI